MSSKDQGFDFSEVVKFSFDHGTTKENIHTFDPEKYGQVKISIEGLKSGLSDNALEFIRVNQLVLDAAVAREEYRNDALIQIITLAANKETSDVDTEGKPDITDITNDTETPDEL